MKNRTLFIILFLLSFRAVPLVYANPFPKKQKKTSCEHSMRKKNLYTPIEKQVNDLMLQNEGFGGVIFRISQGKKILWEGAEGYLDASRKAKINIRSTFEIASVTKTFTASVILQLVEEKKLSLNSKLGTLLPYSIIEHLLVFNKEDLTSEITVQQLLNHTSGLAHFWDDPPYVKKGYNTFFSKFVKDENRIWHPIETLSYVPQMHPRGLPGSYFHYSDTNYVLLGILIESIEKKPLHEIFRKRIFNPLKMKDTYLSYREKATSRHRESHRFFEDEDLHGKEQWSADWASGGLVSSTRDLELFMRALSSGKFFKSKKTLQLMQSWITAEDGVYYGLGIYKMNLDHNKGILWGHDGWGGAFMYYWPEKDIIFTGTTNQTGSEDDDSENEWWKLVDEGLKLFDKC